MKNIDFLPSSYREQNDQRRAILGRMLLVVMLSLAVGAATYSQYSKRRELMGELEKSQLLHKQASSNQSQLSDLESQLHRARSIANLVTYLRHPWPRTNILSALLEPLPPEITLDKVQVTRETIVAATARRNKGPAPPNVAATEPTDETAAARQDLADLREEIDPSQTLVWISGITQDNNALHLYLVKLGHSRLLRDPELKSVESSPTDAGNIRFVATIRIKPGYGRPVNSVDAPDQALPQVVQREAQP